MENTPSAAVDRDSTRSTAQASQTTSGPDVYRLINVLKRREKGGNVFELHIPEMVVGPGQFVALVGASGCGKSTLLDMLAMVLKPTSATEFSITVPRTGRQHHVMEMDDEAMARVRMAQLGYVLQTGGLLPFLSVRDNIMLPCRINGINDRRGEVDMLVQRLGISGQMSKKPAHLSGGQRQRVAIARALAHRPPIVLADEPTAAVDKYTARDIRDEFKELTQQMQVTLLMVTHDESLVAGVVDRTFGFKVKKLNDQHTQSTLLEEK